MTGAHLTKEYVAQPSVTRSVHRTKRYCQERPSQTVDHALDIFTGPIIIRVKSSAITNSPEIAPAIANQNIAHVRRFHAEVLPTRNTTVRVACTISVLALAKASRRAAAAAWDHCCYTEVGPDCSNPDAMPGKVYRLAVRLRGHRAFRCNACAGFDKPSQA